LDNFSKCNMRIQYFLSFFFKLPLCYCSRVHYSSPLFCPQKKQEIKYHFQLPFPVICFWTWTWNLFIYLFLSSRLSNAPSNRSETNDYWLNELSVISLSRGFDWLPPQWGSVDASPLSLWLLPSSDGYFLFTWTENHKRCFLRTSWPKNAHKRRLNMESYDIIANQPVVIDNVSMMSAALHTQSVLRG